jgi:hypothetical protein
VDEGIAFPLYYPHSQILNKKCGVSKKNLLLWSLSLTPKIADVSSVGRKKGLIKFANLLKYSSFCRA